MLRVSGLAWNPYLFPRNVLSGLNGVAANLAKASCQVLASVVRHCDVSSDFDIRIYSSWLDSSRCRVSSMCCSSSWLATITSAGSVRDSSFNRDSHFGRPGRYRYTPSDLPRGPDVFVAVWSNSNASGSAVCIFPKACAFYLFIRQPMGRKSALRREIPWILRGFQGRLSC